MTSFNIKEISFQKLTDQHVHLTEAREQKIRKVVSNRQMDLTVVLENVHDPHNIGAVMRTCDAVGISKLYMIVSDARVWDKIELGINASAGARKWVDVLVYDDYEKCFGTIRETCKHIYGTYLAEDSLSLYDIDFCQPTAIVFGNEHEGLTKEALSYLDGNFVIPQYGMVQSLNISVACAVSAYEALRQRTHNDQYEHTEFDGPRKKLLQDYRKRNHTSDKGAFAKIVK